MIDQLASTPGNALSRLIEALGPEAERRGLPPVERWNPAYCGEIDMRIAADGTWHYRGSPIGREPLVRLFASILRREADGSHVLVTPVERVGINVEDAAFVAVELAMKGEGRTRELTFRTNVGDIVTAGPDHRLRFATEKGTGGLKPYVTVRGGLEALLTRALAQELAAMVEEENGGAGVWSGGLFFTLPRSQH